MLGSACFSFVCFGDMNLLHVYNVYAYYNR